MRKLQSPPIKVNSINELHRMLCLNKPLHPLVSVLDNDQMLTPAILPANFLFNFYKISYKKTQNGKIGYGQSVYDFDDGGMVFTAPNQLISITEEDTDYAGFSLAFHSDFIRNHVLEGKIKDFGFFSYNTNEALHLSDKERIAIFGVIESIRQELNGSIDDFSQDVIISYIEVLLNLSNRFYKRQFITRKAVNHDLLARMEQLLDNYFKEEKPLNNGLPTVEYMAEQLHISSSYLSDMLRSLTGQNAQQHIHEKLIEKAKEFLVNTKFSVAEIAYQLGFEHPQSLSRLFRRKINLSPLEYRNSFN
ncbi:MAG: helix-turn-helix domain-containing protein [Paludibacter sp.]|nr:helix-turn-helix domain-containing protein [Paludibacter sp.]